MCRSESDICLSRSQKSVIWYWLSKSPRCSCATLRIEFLNVISSLPVFDANQIFFLKLCGWGHQVTSDHQGQTRPGDMLATFKLQALLQIFCSNLDGSYL